MNSKNFKAKSSKFSKKKGSNTLIIGIVAAILLAGLAYFVFAGDSTKNPDSQGKTVAEYKLPSYAYTNPIALKAYKYGNCSIFCGIHRSFLSNQR